MRATTENEQVVNIAATMYDYRAFAKRVHKENYAKKAEEAACILFGAMIEKKNHHVMDVLLELLQELKQVGKDDAGSVMLLTAGALEIMEGHFKIREIPDIEGNG